LPRRPPRRAFFQTGGNTKFKCVPVRLPRQTAPANESRPVAGGKENEMNKL